MRGRFSYISLGWLAQTHVWTYNCAGLQPGPGALSLLTVRGISLTLRDPWITE
ncbi:hypothetical protein BC477_07335 [Clavibacter michiganensis subsp. michiganensis]|uniref:Uncharacterized protein n=1 Tax=Clavibacter michiganensis subsp. michiganensis TaxID=33013 RepID=A0A251XM60_CLAMM|nr:hypothetical protein BC477_07335 [Clavibacter michiganensis subsp. michiganensis]OUE04531.1 hypothetical protein CMMCAS07_06265 [Clavibacter michiganensis subsp. michiganensis]